MQVCITCWDKFRTQVDEKAQGAADQGSGSAPQEPSLSEAAAMLVVIRNTTPGNSPGGGSQGAGPSGAKRSRK